MESGVNVYQVRTSLLVGKGSYDVETFWCTNMVSLCSCPTPCPIIAFWVKIYLVMILGSMISWERRAHELEEENPWLTCDRWSCHMNQREKEACRK